MTIVLKNKQVLDITDGIGEQIRKAFLGYRQGSSIYTVTKGEGEPILDIDVSQIVLISKIYDVKVLNS